MRILVTGGAGYIGSHTVAHLLRCGHDVVVLDNLAYGHREAVPPGLLEIGDISDRARVEAVLQQHHIEAAIHFAAFAYVGESVTDPAKYYGNNLIGTLALLEAFRAQGVNRIVFSSTCATYGIPDQVPIVETEKQEPVNPYGFTKLAIERALRDYASAYNIGSIALRYFNASGAAGDGSLGEDHDPETHLIPLILEAALGRRDAIRIFGTDYPTPDGTCIRDYIHVEDLADAHMRALESVQPGGFDAFNVGTGRGYSVRQVIEAARKVTGRAIEEIEQPRRPGDPPELVAEPTKIQDALGWEPAYNSIERIIETAWRWHRAHPNGYATTVQEDSVG